MKTEIFFRKRENLGLAFNCCSIVNENSSEEIWDNFNVAAAKNQNTKAPRNNFIAATVNSNERDETG